MKRLTLEIGVLLFAAAVQARDIRYSGYVGLEAAGGVAHLLLGQTHGTTTGKAAPQAGWGLAGSVFYELEYRHFLFHTGIGTDYTVGNNLLTIPEHVATMQEYSTMLFRYTFSQFRETTTYGVLYVPLQVGGEWDKVYFLVGVKLGVFPFACTTHTRSQVQTWATDQDIIDPLHDLLTHDMHTFRISGNKQPIAMPWFNAMLSAEVGAYLPARQPALVHADCRMAVFMDLGLTNLHRYTPNPAPYGEEATGGIIDFRGLTDLQPLSAFGYAPWQSATLHNLLLGIKLTVRFRAHSYKTCLCINDLGKTI